MPGFPGKILLCSAVRGDKVRRIGSVPPRPGRARRARASCARRPTTRGPGSTAPTGARGTAAGLDGAHRAEHHGRAERAGRGPAAPGARPPAARAGRRPPGRPPRSTWTAPTAPAARGTAAELDSAHRAERG